MKGFIILGLFLNLAGTLMLVFGLDFNYDEDLKCVILKRNTALSIWGIVVLIVTFFLQTIIVVIKS